MWIMTKGGFASVVQHRDKPDMLLVRCRCREDIEFFAQRLGVEWFTDDTADYRFRLEAPGPAVAGLLADLLSEIDYDNFKNSLPPDSPLYGVRSRAYLEVWGDLYAIQREDARVDA